MTSAQKLKMLTNEAKAMGDVSPKEALAQRVISIGKDLLKQKHSSAELAPLPAPARTQQLQAKKMQAAARLAQRHSNPARDAKPAAAAAAAQQKQASVLGGKESVDAARKRVALLRKELKQVPLPSFLSPVLQSSVRSLSLSADAQHAVLFVRVRC